MDIVGRNSVRSLMGIKGLTLQGTHLHPGVEMSTNKLSRSLAKCLEGVARARRGWGQVNLQSTCISFRESICSNTQSHLMLKKPR